jgi:hypothetical protein
MEQQSSGSLVERLTRPREMAAPRSEFPVEHCKRSLQLAARLANRTHARSSLQNIRLSSESTNCTHAASVPDVDRPPYMAKAPRQLHDAIPSWAGRAEPLLARSSVSAEMRITR